MIWLNFAEIKWCGFLCCVSASSAWQCIYVVSLTLDLYVANDIFASSLHVSFICFLLLSVICRVNGDDDLLMIMMCITATWISLHTVIVVCLCAVNKLAGVSEAECNENLSQTLQTYDKLLNTVAWSTFCGDAVCEWCKMDVFFILCIPVLSVLLYLVLVLVLKLYLSTFFGYWYWYLYLHAKY